MEDTAILSILGDIDLVAMCVTGSDVMAASDKGYREFNKNGVPYRATDYDPRQKRRVPVPIRDSQQVVPPMPPEVKELVNLPAPLQKQASQYAIQGLAIAAKSLDGEFASEDAKKGFFDNARAIVKQLREDPGQFFKTMWENTQPLREKLKTHWDNNSDLYIGGALFAGGIALLVGSIATMGGAMAEATVASNLIAGEFSISSPSHARLVKTLIKAGLMLPRLAATGLVLGAVVAVAGDLVAHSLPALQTLCDKMFFSKEEALGPFGGDVHRVKRAMKKAGIDYEVLSRVVSGRVLEGMPDQNKVLYLEEEKRKIDKLIEEKQDALAKIKPKFDDQAFLGSEYLDKKRGLFVEIDPLSKELVVLQNKRIEIEQEIYDAKGLGYSLRKRVMELTELIEKGEKDSASIRWRKLVIKSECKYGEAIDGLKGATEEELPSAYQRLLDRLSEQKAAEGNFVALEETERKAIQSILGNPSDSAQELMEIITPPEEFKDIANMGIGEAVELQRLIKVPLNVSYGVTATRAFSLPGKMSKGTEAFVETLHGQGKAVLELNAFKEHDGIVNIGNHRLRQKGLNMGGYDSLAQPYQALRETVFHETGHVLELKLGMGGTSATFRKERDKETPVEYKVKMPDIPATETDHFFHPYVGVPYAKDFATEIVSSGIEALSSPYLAKKVANIDRETMLYAMGVMDYEPDKN